MAMTRWCPPSFGILLLGAVVISSQSTALLAQQLDGLFIEARSSVAGRSVADDRQPDLTALRSRDVAINFGPPERRGSGLDSRATLLLNLFEDVSYVAVLDRIDWTARGVVWVGHIPAVNMSSVTLATEDGVMYGSVLTPEAAYIVRSAGAGLHAIVQIDQAAFAPEAPPVEVEGAQPDIGLDATDPSQRDDGSTIDVMVLYTPAAAAAAGGVSAMNALVAASVSVTNTSYGNSNVVQRLRLVYSAQVAYTESGDITADLASIRAGVGAFSGVGAIRNAYAADLVTLMTHTPGSPFCGVAYHMANVSNSFAPAGYNVVEQLCAVGNLSFPHELGHNMGARHDWYVDNGVTPYSYAHGHVNAGATASNRWRTIMAYNDRCAAQGFNCARLTYWSNPGLLYNGAAMGVPAGTSTSCVTFSLFNPPCNADDHLALNNTAMTVANFRAALVVTSLTSNAVSPVTVGAPVTWTATAVGGTPAYTYKFWVFDGTSWTVGRDWGGSNAWVWTPPVGGTYSFQVWARNSGSATAYDAWLGAGPVVVTVTVPLPLTVTGVTPNPSSVTAGSPVTWTASAAGGTGPLTYKFLVWDGAAWAVGQEWSASNAWTWTPPAAGTFSFQVWARNALSGAVYDAWRSFGPMTVGVPGVLTVTGLTANRTFPVPAGTPLTWTASAIGGADPYTYRFLIFDGASWSVGQDWSTSNTWTWIPPTAGTYMLQVWVRNAGSGAAYDAWRGAGPSTVGLPTALSVTGLSADRVFPVPAGTPVTWMTTAVGGTGPYTYKFYVWNGSSWTLGQDWSAANTWTWIPLTAGSYSLQVWARNAASVTPYDAWLGAGPVGIGTAAPLSAPIITVAPFSPLVVGGRTTITATVTGGTGPHTYQFWVHNGATWTMGQSWSGSNTFAWTPPAAGTYTIQAWVRNAGSVTAWDTWGSVGPLTVIPSGVVPFSKIAPTNGTTWLSNIPDSDLADEQRGRELR